MHAYATYYRLIKTLERHEILIQVSLKRLEQKKMGEIRKSKKLVKHEDIIKLYVAMLENLAEMKNMPICDSDHVLSSLIQARIWIYHAYR